MWLTMVDSYEEPIANLNMTNINPEHKDKTVMPLQPPGVLTEALICIYV